MDDNRRAGLTEEELETIANKLAVKLSASGDCRLTDEQQREVIKLITTKKWVVKGTLFFMAAVVLWVMKDVYITLKASLAWIK